MKALRWLPGIAWLGSIIWLLLKLPDPFGLGFWIAVFSFLVTGFASGFQLAIYLIRKKKVWVKVTAFVPFIFSMILLVLCSSLAYDYRVLLPGVPVRDKTAVIWKKDYESLRKALLTHPAFKDSLDASFFSDSVDFNKLNDDESLIEFMKMAAKLPDGHTQLLPLQPAMKARYFPFQGYWFDDGYYIVKASQRFKELEGQPLMEINGVSINDLLSRINQLTGPENPWNAKRQFDQFVFSANVLHGLRIINTTRDAQLTTVDRNGIHHVTVVDSEPFSAWFFWAFKPIAVMELSPALINLRKPNYSISYDAVHHSILIPLHAIRNQGSETLVRLSEELQGMLNASHPEKIIIDLRNSLGGDNTLYNELVKVISEREKSIEVYILISRKTFSASVNFISELKAATDVTLVGEPTGAGPNHYGDAHHVLLPETGISVFISTRKWVFDSVYLKHYYTPDVPVKYLYSDFLNSRDPWLDAVYRKQ